MIGIQIIIFQPLDSFGGLGTTPGGGCNAVLQQFLCLNDITVLVAPTKRGCFRETVSDYANQLSFARCICL